MVFLPLVLSRIARMAMIRRSLSRIRWSAVLALLVGTLVFVPAILPQDNSEPAPELNPAQLARSNALSLKLRCMCGGCNDTVGTCNHTGGSFSGPCDTAKAMRKEINQRIARGESDDLILQDFVQEYGSEVLVTPPAKGFNWLMWIAPIVLPILAFVLVWELVRRWRRHSILLPEGPAISPELLARARQEAGEESHE
jgi:cytochrome c-type biogenesis protein CcmH